MDNFTNQNFIENYKAGERLFDRVNLQNSFLTNLDLRGVCFENSNLTGTNFSHSNLSGARFISCNLTRCVFDHCDLRKAVFEKSDMRHASIKDVVIEDTSFKKSDLMWAHLCGNNLMRANISEAILEWTCLLGSRMAEDQIKNIPHTALVSANDQEKVYTISKSIVKEGYTKSNSDGYKSERQENVGVYKREPLKRDFKRGHRH